MSDLSYTCNFTCHYNIYSINPCHVYSLLDRTRQPSNRAQVSEGLTKGRRMVTIALLSTLHHASHMHWKQKHAKMYFGILEQQLRFKFGLLLNWWATFILCCWIVAQQSILVWMWVWNHVSQLFRSSCETFLDLSKICFRDSVEQQCILVWNFPPSTLWMITALH